MQTCNSELVSDLAWGVSYMFLILVLCFMLYIEFDVSGVQVPRLSWI